MTRVYNYFALPPAQDRFCDAALVVSAEALAPETTDLDLFAMQALPRIEREFETFFRAYEQYRTDLAAWDARYGPPTPEVRTTFYSNSNGTPSVGSAANPAAGQTVIELPATTDEGATPIETTATPASDAVPPPAPLPTQGPIILPQEILQSPGSDYGPQQDGETTGSE